MRRSKKTSKIRVNGLCERNKQVTGEFPPQRFSNGKMFPFDDVIVFCDIYILSKIKLNVMYRHSGKDIIAFKKMRTHSYNFFFNNDIKKCIHFIYIHFLEVIIDKMIRIFVVVFSNVLGIAWAEWTSIVESSIDTLLSKSLPHDIDGLVQETPNSIANAL